MRHFIRRATCALCLLIPLASSATLKGEEGKSYWYGTLDVGVAQLRLLFTVTGKPGDLKATMTSLDQSPKAIPADSISIKDGKLRLKISRIKMEFEGKLNKKNDFAEGTFTQAGNARPLRLRRYDKFTGKTRETWEGVLQAGPRKLRLRFRLLEEPDGKVIGRFDSPDEGITGLPANIKSTANELRIAIPISSAEFIGRKTRDGKTASGKWKQRLASLDFKLVRAEAGKSTIPKPKRPQTPKSPFPYRSLDVKFNNAEDGVTLAGTLTLPKAKGKYPAVIMITGSGPQDRDETIFEHRPFLVIADHLARKGIAVLRFDDRGIGKSTGDFSTATSEGFGRDVMAGFRFLTEHPEIRATSIGLAGHSEGGLIASMLAGRNSQIAFIVMLAGPGVDGRRIAITQSELIARKSGADKATLAAQKAMLVDVLAGVAAGEKKEAFEKRVDAAIEKFLKSSGANDKQAKVTRGAIGARMKSLSSPWFRFFLKYDPAADLKRTKCPVLALIGENDLQVPMKENLEAIRKALKDGGNSDFEAVSLPGLNHLFQRSASGLPNEYAQIEETMAPQVLDRVAAWIAKRTAR